MNDVDPRVVQAGKHAETALRLHRFYHGKIQMLPKCPVRGLDDFANWYTPGVAGVCQAIVREPGASYDLTNRANSIAIVSDGSRVLGLGNIGPSAGLPVMEGKSLLFKFLGGVDAVPLCVSTKSADELIEFVCAIEPSFGGINLEDIAQPKCFRVLDALRSRLNIPVWHDDQQGTATVVLAGLRGALKVVGKSLSNVRIAMIGVGAANVATYRLLRARGAATAGIVACDSQGTLHARREDISRKSEEFPDKWSICRETNADFVEGGIADALRGADVCIAFSAPGPEVIRPEWLQQMARDSIVFTCANPVPEIWPWMAKEAGARIVATGRSDFPNQVNNSLAFPGIFRGALDVRATTISDAMALAAADELAACAESGLSEDRIIPRMDDFLIHARIAVATGLAAQREGLSRASLSGPELLDIANQSINVARRATELLVREQVIPRPPNQ